MGVRVYAQGSLGLPSVNDVEGFTGILYGLS